MSRKFKSERHVRFNAEFPRHGRVGRAREYGVRWTYVAALILALSVYGMSRLA